MTVNACDDDMFLLLLTHFSLSPCLFAVNVQAVQMIESIREEFMYTVDECDWMDSETREDAKRKARNMEVYMGFPEYILDSAQLDKEYEHVS